MKKYQIIYADPPWPIRWIGGKELDEIYQDGRKQMKKEIAIKNKVPNTPTKQ